MSDLYRVQRPDGSVEYTDRPSGPGSTSVLRPGSGTRGAAGQGGEDDKPYDHQLTAKLIKEAQKRIPKITDYLDYVDYLRHHKPWAFERVMKDLQRTNPQTWMKLQKYPQFRPLRETVVGLKAGEKNLSAVMGLASGNITGSAEKWMETTLKDMMKRDAWGPYADVLGSKATTLPTKQHPYPNTAIGRAAQLRDADVAAASKAAAKEAELAKAGLRSARGAAITRSMGPVVDFGIAALNPDTAAATTSFLMRRRLELVARRNPEIDIDTAAYEQARKLLSQARYGELDELLKRHE